MRPKALPLILVLLALAGSALGQESAHLTFGSKGEREVWVFPTLPKEPPADSIKTHEDSIDVSVAGHGATHSIFVWDHATGNLASKALLNAKTGWDVKPEDYIDVAIVKVKVTSAGKPVAACTVELDDHRRKISQLLSPSNAGVATFFAVKPGQAKITIQYKDGAKDAKPVVQLFDVTLQREEATPTLAVAVSGSVDVVSGADSSNSPTIAGDSKGAPVKAGDSKSAKTDAKGESAPTASSDESSTKSGGGSGSPFGGLITGLLGLAVVGGIVWFAYTYAKKNSDQVAVKLENLGVQIPKPGDDPGAVDPGPAPTPVAPAPAPKIVLDDAAPVPLAAAPDPVPATVAANLGPRFVADSGVGVEIQPGENVVGRDVGLWLSLVAESTVSRKHAVVVRTGDAVEVRDSGSTNGTFVNGSKVTLPVTLKPGDAIQFGAASFRYEV